MSGSPGGGERWERVSELFTGALARPPEERGAWLDRQCAGDAELRREVESLLSGRESADGFFEELEAAVAEIPEEELGGPSWVGRRIGPYEIEEELGRGGMGVVYRARDDRLDRLVAIKVLPPWLAGDPAARKRLIAEARAASAIDHPNIAVLHDVVENEDGVVALVLAHYEGETLRRILRRGPLIPLAALYLARQVADGLAAAHARGIVHRDVKPGNLLVTPEGQVKILDFGVATALGAEVTGSGRRGGTVAYMAPERFRGEPPDPRSDLWALGVVLHEMLTGRRPFEGDGEPAIMRAVLDEPPPPLAEPVVAEVVERLLVKDPDGRIQTAEEAVAALDRAAESLPAAGPAGSPADRAPARHWVPAPAVYGSAALGLVLILAGVWMLIRPGAGPGAEGGPPIEPDRLAILPFVVRGDPEVAYLREGIAELLSSSLHGAGGLRTVDPSALLVRAREAEVLDPEAGRRLAGDFGAGRFVLGEVVEAGGRVRIRAALYDHAGDPEPEERVYVEGSVDRLFNLVDEIAGRLIVATRGEGGERLVRVASVTTPSLPAFKRYLEGEEALRDGRFSEAIGSFRAAVEIDSLFALAYYGMSVAAGWSYQADLSVEAAERAVALSERLPPVERRLVEAVLAWPNGELDRAESLYREVLAEQPANMEAWYNVGELFFHMNALRGRSMAEARGAFQRANRLSGYDHYESLVHLADLAARDRRLADYDSLHALLDPEAELAPVYRAQHALLTGDAEAREATIAELRAAEPNVVRAVAGRLAAFALDPAAAAEVAALLTDPDRPADWRAVGDLRAALFEAGRGRWSSADRHLDAAGTHAPQPALVLRAYLWSLPFAPADRSELESVRAALEAWDPTGAPALSNPFLDFHGPLYGPLRDYLLGGLAVRLGDGDAARRAADVLGARTGSTPGDSLMRELGGELRARVTGDLSTRLDLLVGGRPHFGRPYGVVARSPFYSRATSRFLLAETLFRARRLRQAAGWYESFLGPYVHDAVFQAPALLRLAAIEEARGDPGRAAEHYHALIDLLEDADPALRPWVDEARRRLSALQE